MLLSTKKGSGSGLLGKSKSTVGVGNSSQQDGLLNALQGISQVEETKVKETPQAWGSRVGDVKGVEATNTSMHGDSKQRNPPVSKTVVVDRISTSVVPSLKSEEVETTAFKSTNDGKSKDVSQRQNSKDASVKVVEKDEERAVEGISMKEVSSMQALNGSNNNESQVEFMARLAQESKEKRRKEEEARTLEQKERAAERLQALEKKMGPKSNTSSGGVILENLSRNPPNSKTRRDNANNSRVDQTQKARTLYDPSRPYNSSVGANGGRKNESPKKTDATERKNAGGSPPIQKIQLSGYDDQGRGERSSSSGPRMLFDPKSGSMVAVSKRDDAGTTSSSKSRRDRAKEKGRNGKDTGRRNEAGYGNRLDGSRPLSRKERKREGKERKHSADASGSRSPNSIDNGTSHHGGKNSSNRKDNNKLPRTRGVLYKRDENGNLLSADGCDGDVGYGSHSVPGGRLRNAKAYTSYSKISVEAQNNAHNYNHHHLTDTSGFHMDHEKYAMNLPSSLTRDHFMRSPKKVHGDNSQILPEPVTVKPNERIEILTGLEESPTLQATAAVWAPSEAALAELKKKTPAKISKKTSLDDEGDISESEVHAINAMAVIDNDVEECHQSPSVGLGLGFDPTKNMDYVMMSPDEATETSLPNLPRPLSNPFASSHVLGSSTWSAAGSMGSLSDWAYSRNDNKAGIDPTQNTSEEDVINSTSFLSLGTLGNSQSTWSTGGIGGGFSRLGDFGGSNNIQGDTD